MDIKLDFNPEEIAQKMSEAIVSSTFRQMFENAVKAEIDRLNDKSQYWSASKIVDGVVKDYIQKTMRDLLENEYKTKIEDGIRAALKDEKIKEITEELVSKIKINNY